MPHFEEANGRKVLYVDGRPFTVLAVEIPWWDLIYGRYRETETAYDFLYPAAEKMSLNALKVPIKWSMIEPEKGVYDFSYLDHAKSLAEQHHLKLILNWFGHYVTGSSTAQTKPVNRAMASLISHWRRADTGRVMCQDCVPDVFSSHSERLPARIAINGANRITGVYRTT
jgi:hypothetical protein